MWTIKLLEYTNNDDKAVLVAHWGCELVDGDYSASSYGTCGFSPDPTDPAYIPFESLTEADVLEWVYAAVDKDAVEAGLIANIEDQKAPKTEVGLPW
jgi:hypothetical protein